MTARSEDKQTIQVDPRLRYPYPYFRMHLAEITACIEAGCSVKSVWEVYATRASEPFPGSYSSFLRYCRKHCKSGAVAARKAEKAAPEATPGRAVSVLGQGKRYPPPRKRPPGLTPEQIDRMMDADADLDSNR